MGNDIRKNIMLIEAIILDESFKDAERIFTDANGNQKEVSSYIALFRELAKRNKIQGVEKDITRWIRSGWEAFKEFVDSRKEVQSKREVRSIQKKDSIQVYQDEEKLVVIPLTKEASIHYGKNTKWCTSATESKNHFIKYFYTNGITLFYVLFKNGDKYACAFHPSKPDTIEYFDQMDKSISFNEFSNATGISKNDIHGWYSSNKGVIVKARDINNLDEDAQIELVKENPSIIRQIKSPSEQVQLAAVNQNGNAIAYIINNGITPSESVQLAAVSQYGYVIKYIINKGITPSEAVQLTAVQNHSGAIEHIIDKGIVPSEQVQLAAVQKDGYAIEYIIDKGIEPSEQVQLAAVQRSIFAIRHIDNPSEAVQLAAIQKDGSAIEQIENPSEAIQLATVQKRGYAIRYIINNGITPSEQVQLTAVQNYGTAIYYIDNPSEKVQLAAVKQNGIAIEHIDSPSEAVQLAAVSQNGRAIKYIKNPSEKAKQLHKELWKK